MDSLQPTTKRGFKVDSLTNQDDGMVSMNKEEEGRAEVMRFKQEEQLHPLNMENVLEIIFGYLDVKLIKAAREVNPIWSAEGAKMLINKCFVKIPSDLKLHDLSSNSSKMENFKAFLSHKASETSMIPNITIKNFDDVKLWESLRILGPKVESVKLDGIDGKVKLLSKLFDLLPNLNHLSFRNLDYKPKIIKVLTTEMSKADRIQNQLIISFMDIKPNNEEHLEDLEKFADCKNIMLTELNFDLSNFNPVYPGQDRARVFNTMKKLLLASHNILKRLSIQDTWLEYKTEIIKALTSVMSIADKDRAPLIISLMTLNSVCEEQLVEMEKFAECDKIVIEELKFEIKSNSSIGASELNAQRVANMMSKLLSRSQNVIKRLTIKSCELLLNLIEFPCLTKLTGMNLDFHPRNVDQLSSCKFPRSFKFSENVPKLHHLIINYGGEFLNSLFETSGAAPSVKHLKCLRKYSDIGVEILLTTFPNVEDLLLTVDQYSETMFQPLWTLGTNLKKLYLYIEVPGSMKDAWGLDSSLIGFSIPTVSMLNFDLYYAPYTRKLEDLEELRVNPSILNLKGLKLLTIYFPGNNQQWPEKLLALSGKYAFSLMPDTKIVVRGLGRPRDRERARQSLEEVSKLPNVEFRFGLSPHGNMFDWITAE